jgi:hypothetical protein
VGRYTSVKRLPLLVGAHARALERLARPLPLILVGGHPGEWEGQHPLAAARALGNAQSSSPAGGRTPCSHRR